MQTKEIISAMQVVMRRNTDCDVVVRIDLRIQTLSERIQTMQLVEHIQLHDVHSRIVGILDSVAFKMRCLRLGNGRNAPLERERKDMRTCKGTY